MPRLRKEGESRRLDQVAGDDCPAIGQRRQPFDDEIAGLQLVIANTARYTKTDARRFDGFWQD